MTNGVSAILDADSLMGRAAASVLQSLSMKSGVCGHRTPCERVRLRSVRETR